MCLECLLRLPLNHLSGSELFDRRAMYENAVTPPAMAEAWFCYDPQSEYAALIKDMKYHGRPRLGFELGKLYASELMRRPSTPDIIGFADIDVLLPIPMYKFKKLRRGFNQSEEIARGMAAVSGAAVADNLVAIRGHDTQTRLSGKQRSANLRGCFELHHGKELAGLNVAVIDDIITTGASVSEALLAISHDATDIASVSVFALGATRRAGG